MPTDHRAKLAKIKRFDQLIVYLHNEMGWPITGDDFEELTFDYSAEELGIDAKNAAKIEEIKRMRPLSVKQPWGIFFVKFEPKRLPVVALRRILSQVVMKKRATARAAEQAAWAVDDLLFVSNYGEGDDRRICLAHFTEDREAGNLATLNVLGWDGQDTGLHLDAVAQELTEHLAWPKDDSDREAWREQWRSAFTLRHREVITTARALAIRLAELAKSIRVKVLAALAIETERGKLRRLMKAFQESLIHDLDEDSFADMYAQTIAYGLLSARVSRQSSALVAEDAAGIIVPVTSPFLRELMETFLNLGGRKRGTDGAALDFDELGISEVVKTLRDANMDAVLRDFGDKNPQEDPVIHFYEHFLAAYDKKLKVQRGVFYTPRPVVSYIVRSVDELLRSEFGLEDGLADTATWGEMAKRHKDLAIPDGASPDQAFVQILDPACGTGTFLVEVIDVIYRTMSEKWRAQGHGEKKIDALWNEYVPKHLLTRLHGYELLMAPYAIAHLKLGLKLFETGYRFGAEGRAHVYMTNSLEPSTDSQLRLDILPALAHEARAVNEIKRDTRFTVVIGNPPYSNFGMMNKLPFILRLLHDYKRDLGEKKLNLDDDFIKFIRFGHYLVARSGAGILGMITNNTYIDGITHRQMRHSLMDAFAELFLVDLHGSAAKKEACPDGSRDENVFDIQQGVGISILAAASWLPRSVKHFDVWGVREEKYRVLREGETRAQHWVTIEPTEPYYFFVPKDFTRAEEYMQWRRLPEVFMTNGPGVKTERDGVSIHWTRAGAEDAIDQFRSLSVAEIRKRFELGSDSRDWRVESAKADVMENESGALMRRILYRPFDVRHTWYSGKTRGFIGTPGFPVMRHMLEEDSLGLLAMRQFEYDVPEYCYFYATRGLTECRVFVSNRGIANVFPLYLSAEGHGKLQLHVGGRRTNFRPDFLRDLASSLGLQFDELKGLPEGVSAEAVFCYMYAVFHSPLYRRRYAESLKIDFPRVPCPSDSRLLRELSGHGRELVSLHTMESSKLDDLITSYEGPQNPEVGRVGWWKNTVWLDATATKKGQPATAGAIGFRGVPEAVWNFHIGGYQVCEKWLKDRKGRTLSQDDIIHYQKIVVALNETIRLMKEIDEVIEVHGGWPEAFAVGEKAKAVAAEKVVAFPVPERAGPGESKPLRKAAEPKEKYKTSTKRRGRKP